MYQESLGQHAAQLNFNLVRLDVIEGRYLPNEKKQSNPINNGGVFFKTIREQFFDKTAVDIMIAEEVRRKYRKPKPANTVEGIIELASHIALETESVSNKHFGKKHLGTEERLSNLLEHPIPSELDWERDIKGEVYPLPLFIDKVVPFLRTKEWLQDRLSGMARADSDRFIASIQIRRKPALQVV